MDKCKDTYDIAQDTKLLLLLYNSQYEHSIERNHMLLVVLLVELECSI